jgi:hypothetical protein
MGLLDLVKSKEESILSEIKGCGSIETLYSPKVYREQKQDEKMGIRIMGVEDAGRHEIWLTYYTTDSDEMETSDMRASIFWKKLGENQYQKSSNIFLKFDRHGGTLIYRNGKNRQFASAEYAANVKCLMDELVELVR